MERLERLAERLRKTQQATDAARRELHVAVLEALRDGATQADVARATGYTRERIRQITRRAQ